MRPVIDLPTFSALEYQPSEESTLDTGGTESEAQQRYEEVKYLAAYVKFEMKIVTEKLSELYNVISSHCQDSESRNKADCLLSEYEETYSQLLRFKSDDVNRLLTNNVKRWKN